MVDLSIIIVSWNVRKHLERCLASIAEAVRGVSFEVFVVDNASTDGTVEWLTNYESRIKNNGDNQLRDSLFVIRNSKNLGFSAANNQAIRKARGKYILLLNPDTELISNGSADPLRRHAAVSGKIGVLGGGGPSTELQRKGATKHSGFPSPALGESSIDTSAIVGVGDAAEPSNLKSLLHFMESHPRCGILGPKLLNSDGTLQPSVRRFPRALDPLLFSLGMAHQYLARDFDYTKAQQVDQVMGAAFLIRRSMCDAIGMLDERFFIWFEEVDYCKRAKDAGWEVWYTPNAIVLHHGGESFAQVLTIKKQWMYMKSLLYYFQKYAQWWAYGINFFTLPFRLMLALAREIVSLSRRQRRDSSQ